MLWPIAALGALILLRLATVKTASRGVTVTSAPSGSGREGSPGSAPSRPAGKRRPVQHGSKPPASQPSAPNPPAPKPDPIKELLDSSAPAVKPAQKPAHRPTRKPAPKPPPKPAHKPAARKPAPAPKPAPKRPARKPAPKATPDAAFFSSDQRQAAEALVKHVRESDIVDSAEVALRQREMGSLDPDGIVGARTKALVEQILKRSIDWPHDLPVSGPPPDLSSVSESDAAMELWDYVHTWRGSRKDRIAAYQKRLGLGADGIVGPKTKARVKQLTGKDW